MLDLSLPDRWEALLNILKGPGQRTRRPFMVPTLPEGLVARPREVERLKSNLINTEGDGTAVTVALRGAGGFGKTTVAQAVGHDDDIRDAFHDGVLWVTLGERPDVLGKLGIPAFEWTQGVTDGYLPG
jgi:hypothetical protein